MAELTKARWLLCEECPGVILADLGDEGAPDVLTVDVNASRTDEEVVALAAYIVDLHNARLAAAVPT